MEDLPSSITRVKEELKALRTNGSGYTYHKYFQLVSPTSTSGSTKTYRYNLEFVPDVGKNDKVFCEMKLIVTGTGGWSNAATTTLGDRFKGTCSVSVNGNNEVYASVVSNQTGLFIVE